MSFEQIGIPVGYGFRQLLFSAVAKTLVVQTCSASEGWRPERLYFRHIDADRYQPVGVPSELVSRESPFIHPTKPLLAFVSNQHKFIVDGEGQECHFADWHSLTILNLQDGPETESVNETNLLLPSGAVRGWICDVVGFGDTGLFVKVALSKSNTPSNTSLQNSIPTNR